MASSVKRVHALVNKVAKPYAKAYHGYHKPMPANYLHTGRKGTALRKLVADRIKLERKHGMIKKRDGYKGSKYVHSTHFTQY